MTLPEAPSLDPLSSGQRAILSPVESTYLRRRRWSVQIVLRLIRKRSALFGLAILAVIVLASLLAPYITRYDPDTMNALALNRGPSGAHPFGTDSFGRDLWSRVVWGSRLSLPVGAGVVAIEFFIGSLLGLVAGYGGRLLDDLIMRAVDIQLALPGLLLPLGIVVILGFGTTSTIVALGIAGIPGYARLARGTTLRIREMEFIEAARSIGRGETCVLLRHVLPNIMDSLIVHATLSLGGAILAAAVLSYLGVGVQPPDADWGTLLQEGTQHMFQAWSEIAFPGLVVTLTILSINLVGDGLADAIGPRG